jgi:hypothetical protein
MDDINTPDPNGKCDPFDPARLRVTPSGQAGDINFKKKLVTIRVGKPYNQEFVRAHPEESYRIDTAIIEDKRNCEYYLVDPAVRDALPRIVRHMRLVLAVTRHGFPFLWPAYLPNPNARPIAWHTSMLDAQSQAVHSWVRVESNMRSSCYEITEGTGIQQQPEWPELSFREILQIGFRTRLIEDLSHPFILQLQGKV